MILLDNKKIYYDKVVHLFLYAPKNFCLVRNEWIKIELQNIQIIGKFT